MDLHYSQTVRELHVLKLHCFTTLWIYTILKHVDSQGKETQVSLPYGFTLFSNMSVWAWSIVEFHYLMDLHYSQTTTIFLNL